MEILFALIVTVCINGQCDAYVVDHDFTLDDCKKAATELVKQNPRAQWECVILDLE